MTKPLISTADSADAGIVRRAGEHSMTGEERLLSLVDSVRYCVRNEVPGSFAECGVWRGGSVLAMLLTLADVGASDRDVYLYDTFSGMTEPTERDTSPIERPAVELWEESGGDPYGPLFDPDRSGEDAVRATLASAGYPAERLHFVKGPVEETIPAHAPEQLALLRLDTDWYESTRHELVHMYPRLVSGGVLIIDDYGHWDGCRAAVDEYFAEAERPPLLQRVDYSCRVGVKP